MSYVKNFEVGNVRLDTPNKHIVHELPLLSFGDARNTFALSLIFQSKLTTNPFYIANGYKLSIQKRIILSDGYPQSYEDGNGTLTKLNRFVDKYAFDDGSQRFIRLINGQYILENPDYSTEMFTTDGRILSVKDKYGNTILSYSYSVDKLISVVYKGTKTVTFGYSGSALQYIQYTYSGVAYKTTFAYSGSKVIVSHYSGVDYHLTYASGNFEVFSANAGGVYSNDMSYKDSVIVNGNIITIEKYRGDKKLDKVIYNFVNCDSSGKANILDITDFHNVTTRVQFMKEKPAYSYEMLDTMFIDYPVKRPADQSIQNVPYYPGCVSFYNNENVAGTQGYGDGEAMERTTNTHYTDFNRFMVYLDASGPVMVSGWIKSLDEAEECDVTVYVSGVSQGVYTVKNLKTGVWKYFAFTVNLQCSTFVEVFTSLMDDRVAANDFRLTCQHEADTEPENYKDSITQISNALICTDAEGNDQVITIDDQIVFLNGSTEIDKTNYPITANDLMRYKINQAIGTNKNEIYYNECRGIITNAGEFNVRYTLDGTTNTVALADLSVAVIQTTKYNTFSTKSNFYTESGVTSLKVEATKNTHGLKSDIYDSNLDLVQSVVEGITTTYLRNANTGLIESQTITDVGNTSEMTCSAVYDANDFLVSTTDEFGVVTTYTTNATWGVVTKSAVSNGLTVTDTFDDDFTTQNSREFGTGTVKKHEFTYFPSGLLYTIKNDTLNYTMGYTADILSSVTKNDQPMEQINISDDRKTMTAYYPGFLDTEYTITQRYDKYGRLIQIDDQIRNTYDINPIFDVESLTFKTEGIDNSSGKLATRTDLTTGKTTVFSYDKNLPWILKTRNSSNEDVGVEKYTYDDVNRLIALEVRYDVSNSRTTKSEIAYLKSPTEPQADNTVSSYAYKVDNARMSYSYNNYDALKRMASKITTVGYQGLYFNRAFAYNGSRVSNVSDTFSGANRGTDTYEYDAMGRITSHSYSSAYTNDNKGYIYDSFGQLVRENNQALDKTFIYEYDGIGNITSVKKYAYTTGDVGTTPQSTDTYVYDGNIKDRLITFNGTSISYDSMGCPTYYNNKTYTWNRGKLTRIHRGYAQQPGSLYENCVFTYDAYGRRLSKSYTYDPNPASTSDYSYTYNTTYDYDNSGRLIREYCVENYISGATTTREFVYLYDETGIIGVMYNYNGNGSQAYYYRRNLQGDVIAIYDQTGSRKAEYAYDAWGNCTVKYAGIYDLAHNNPIRYRGYYYDRETGMYYLNARYYNPQWRRFISPDSTEYIDSENPNGLNLYTYCCNDPVNYTDPSGYSAILITLGIMAIGGFIGAAVSAGTSALVQLAINGEVNLKSVGVAAISGFISGAIAASPLGLTGQVIAGGIIGGASYIADCYVNDTAITLDGVILSIGMGALSGRISGPGANEKNVLTNSILQLKKTIARETRRANQKYAQKAIAAMTSYIYNILDVSAFSSSVKFAAGCGVSSAVTTGYANYRLFQNWPSWKFWGE